MKQKIKILFHDENLIVVNKPAPLLTIPDRYKPDKFNLHQYLNTKFDNAFLIHRLDKETSGIMVFAKNETTQQNLSQQFQERTVEKKYLALVEGHFKESEGIIDKPIAPTQGGIHRMIISKKGKPSISHYQVLEQFKKYALVEVAIKTGRTHQIRVHMESIGHSLMIDPVYGRRDSFLLSDLKLKKYRLGKHQEERPLMTRTTLHSSKLSFDNPKNGNREYFEAALPKDFNAVLNQLRKWGKA